MNDQTERRPRLGAALTLNQVRTFRDWLTDGPRDLELQDFIHASVLEGEYQPLVAQARELLSGHTGRLGIHGPFWGFTIDSEDPDIRAVVARRMMQGLDVCDALGATQMVIHSPFTTWDYNNLDDNPTGRAELIERCQLTLGDVVARAEAIGVTLVIENIEDKDPHARVELARSFGSRAVRVSVDTGHAHYAYGSTGAPPVDHYIHAAGLMLDHVHVQDADGYGDRHWVPGEGTIRWASVFRAIRRSSENPRLLLELKDSSRVLEAWAWLKDKGLVD